MYVDTVFLTAYLTVLNISLWHCISHIECNTVRFCNPVTIVVTLVVLKYKFTLVGTSCVVNMHSYMHW